uniref:Uncharacterized protein n=1 Tax=Romanomermis culicivorax TaxID=13658 RepID=A0A915IRH0_ROMCU
MTQDISDLKSRISIIESKIDTNQSHRPSTTQNLNALNIEMLVQDSIERQSKKLNAVLFGLAKDNHDDLESIRQIVTDFGPELTENDTAITADDIVK